MTREEAISEWTFRSNHIKKWLDEYGEEPSIRHYVELIDMAIEALSDRTGEWICKGDDYAVCSECGGSSGTQFDGVERIPKTTAFCPNCGARMNREDGEV